MIRRVRQGSPVTWDGAEELDGVPVAVETELGVSHGAEGDEGPGRHFVAVLVAIDTDGAAGLLPRAAPVGRFEQGEIKEGC